jgi:Pregnancy-associated plasma protein-A
MRLYRYTFALLLSAVSLTAQERCASTPTHSYHTSASLDIRSGDLPEEIVIPVVVHVLWRTETECISDVQIISQIDALNTDFSGKNPDRSQVPAIFAGRAAAAGIRFVLATTDPEGRPTDGIIRKKTSAQLWINDDRIKRAATGGSDGWDSRYYLNIWVGNLSSSLLGFSTFPGAPADKDGIVIRYNVFGTTGTLSPPFDRGRTLTHEAGHWLGLQHLWGDKPCGDDGVDDTPRQRTGNRGTPQFPRINTGCDNGPSGDMFMNFMDFSDDRSLLMFTKGQSERMRAQFTVGGVRREMLQSKGAGEPWNLKPSAEAVLTDQFTMFPNPCTGDRLQIRRTDGTAQRFELTDAGGRLMRSGMLEGQTHAIDVSPLRPGIYHLRVGDIVMKWVRN